MKKEVVSVILLMVLVFPLVSAGVGISWNRETALVPENTDTCLTYGVYNPWPDDSYVKIVLSESLDEIVESYEEKFEFIPRETSSKESIPVEFCFKTPRVYTEDCLVGSFICEQQCGEEMKIYSGEVEVIEVSEKELQGGGSGGSATTMSVSAPLKVKVKCVAHPRNYTLVYVVLGTIAVILLLWNILRKKKGKRKKK